MTHDDDSRRWRVISPAEVRNVLRALAHVAEGVRAGLEVLAEEPKALPAPERPEELPIKVCREHFDRHA